MYRPFSRRGAGIIFIFVIGVLIVLAVFLMTQYFTGKHSTMEIAATDLSNRANIAAESATEECVWFCLSSANKHNDTSGKSGDFYEKIRSFCPSSNSNATIQGPTGFGSPYLFTIPFNVPQTKNYYATSDPSGDTVVGDFTIGILSQRVFPDAPAMTNESYGTLGFEGEVTVKSKTRGRDIQRVVQFAKNFRVLLLHPPYPFNKYTVFIKRTDVGQADRFHSYFDYYEDNNNGTLPPFPILDMTSDARPIVSTAADIPPDAFEVAPLDAASGADLNNLTADEDQELQDGFDAIEDAGFTKLDAQTSLRYANDGYYRQLGWEHLKSAASHYYPSFGQFVNDRSENGVIKLSGVYYIEKGLAIDHTYSGRGVLVTTSTEGVKIRRAERADGAARLVIIAAEGDISFETGGTPGVQIEADLFAPRGTLKNCDGVEVLGIVYVSHIEPGTAPFPRVYRPADTDFTPWSEGESLETTQASKLAVWISPGYCWKKYWNRRL